MTFQAAIDRLNGAVLRTDLEASLPSFLNEAVRQVAVRHSFDEMKKIGTLTIATSTFSAQLPTDFKEFQNGRFPVLDAIGAAAAVRVPVYSRPELERLTAAFRPALHLLHTQDSLVGLVTLPTAASATNVLTLYYFAYPEAVTDYNESTPLLLSFENLVLAKARSLAFQSINDPVAEQHEVTFERELARATGKDIEVSTPAPRENKE